MKKLSIFSIELYGIVMDYYKGNNKDKALSFLYETLMNTSNEGELESCNDFLEYIMEQPFDIDINTHILNILIPYKDKLSNWKRFEQYTKK